MLRFKPDLEWMAERIAPLPAKWQQRLRRAWQDPDYNGPLDAEQAAWRNKHKASWRNPATKPVEGGETK